MRQVLRDRTEEFEDEALVDNPEIAQFRPLLRAQLGLAEPSDPAKLLHHAVMVLGAGVIVRGSDGYLIRAAGRPVEKAMKIAACKPSFPVSCFPFTPR